MNRAELHITNVSRGQRRTKTDNRGCEGEEEWHSSAVCVIITNLSVCRDGGARERDGGRNV